MKRMKLENHSQFYKSEHIDKITAELQYRTGKSKN